MVQEHSLFPWVPVAKFVKLAFLVCDPLRLGHEKYKASSFCAIRVESALVVAHAVTKGGQSWSDAPQEALVNNSKHTA